MKIIMKDHLYVLKKILYTQEQIESLVSFFVIIGKLDFAAHLQNIIFLVFLFDAQEHQG